MLLELEQLADRINQLAVLTQRLRQENQTLRMQVLDGQSEVRQLRAKLNEASQRVAALVQRLPGHE